ncbi:Ribosomal RNA small subunit methyltransferase E [uncultured Clostridium sp.]|uniref:Ribosomal RNA small subunit methyltransferase E n=1 Tax=Muricoprocola aceti TaxID=2981772 RepID=A0ABT2SI10_9FIRM|nr:16S rRNA (uracil(1498)-N(3))-methyltransferase [Muricoprocola aceti]MCU6724120.1 16S rRNA (uracil(1498)-N(3))-methyltransferase [Muricoprocola aceti]SCH00003.1 Ribosomal RNA small subunit methyltransferase E [uncultured Clostridium sp.]
MHRFFVEEPAMGENSITITGGDVNHIKNVLRMSVGDKICVINGQNNKEYYCEITAVGNDAVDTRICEIRESDQELGNEVVLFQGLPKSDKMELIIQKAVELGVHTIVPVSTDRTVVKLDAKKEANKRKRWMSISESAAKQSGRLRIPEVTPVVSYREALEMAKKMDVRLIPYELAEGMEKTRELMSSIQPGQSVAVFIGPEGGFESSEIEKAMEIGAWPITLGKRILRTETAGLVTLAMLVYNLER